MEFSNTLAVPAPVSSNIGHLILHCLLRIPGVVPQGYRTPAHCAKSSCTWYHCIFPNMHMEHIQVSHGNIVLQYDIRVLNVVKYHVTYMRSSSGIMRICTNYTGPSVLKKIIRRAIKHENIRLTSCVKS